MPNLFSQLMFLCRTRGQAIHAWWGQLSHYWQHFFIAVLLGIAIETAIHAAHDFSMVKSVQNAVLDTTLRVFSLREKQDTAEHPMPLLLVIDDTAAQARHWGAGKGLTLTQALRLASHAFDRGAQHVLLDITFDGELAAQMPEDQAALAAFLQRYPAHPNAPLRHLYVARSVVADPCFPQMEALESLKPSVWDNAANMVDGKPTGLMIHSVLPHYRADPDHVVRGWNLFGVLRSNPSSNGVVNEVSDWRFLPSPQLAYQTVKSTPIDQLHSLPWLQPSTATTSLVTRAVFAAEQVNRLPLLSAPHFSRRLCTHHPYVLGCPVQSLQLAVGNANVNPQVALAQVNELLRPLPQEHACRTRATEMLTATEQIQASTHPHDLLFNRIVFNLPSWEQAPELGQRGYYLRTPLGLQTDDPVDWSGRLVVIGAAHAASGDWHRTPIGRISGALINLNAMQSLEQIGPVSSPPGWLSMLINGLIIVFVAAIFSALSPMAAAALSAAILIGSLALFHQYLLSRGIWIEFGAPLIGINLHRIIDGYLLHRKLQHELRQQSQALVHSQNIRQKFNRKHKGRTK